MAYVTIHESGVTNEALRVDSWYNGGAYAIHIGANGAPRRTLWFQGDDAIELREAFDGAESFWPDKAARDIWFHTLTPYL